jgi:hypothetical protein
MSSILEKAITDAVNFILEQAGSGDDADDKDPMSDADNTHVVELNDKLSEEDTP